MTDAPRVTYDDSVAILRLIRSLVAATRAWARYPADHPDVDAAFGRLQGALVDGLRGRPLAIGVSPDTLLIDLQALAVVGDERAAATKTPGGSSR